jgi:hypothetical protein
MKIDLPLFGRVKPRLCFGQLLIDLRKVGPFPGNLLFDFVQALMGLTLAVLDIRATSV